MLAVSHVKKSYGAITALDGVSVEIRAGEIFGLLGPNGAGKSTLISLISGLIAPDSGTISLEGKVLQNTPGERRSLGVATQALAIYEDLSGEENLTFFGALYGLSGSDLAARVRRSLDVAGLTERRNDRASTYSGGMKRRLNLAAALVHGPRVVLLDEPTVGVDPQSRNRIFESIEQLHRDGITIVYTTHYMEEASRLCDRVGIIDHGRLLALDSVDNLLRAHGGPTSVVIEADEGETRIETDDPIGEIIRLRDGSGGAGGHRLRAGIRNVRLEQPDLESVFLRLTGRHLRD